MKLCPNCGAMLCEVIGGYMCPDCGAGVFDEDDVITAKCPTCGGELSDLCEKYYCYECGMSVDKENAIYNGDIMSDNYCEEPDYDSMVDNGEEICLNCTYWNVSPYGSSYGMYCRKGNGQTDPDDTCFEFIQSQSFANYGDNGEFQFDETSIQTEYKLDCWKNSR